MKSTLIIGIVLIALGAMGLIGGRINYTTKEKVIDLGPIEATADKKHSIGIPDAAGIALLIGGIVLCVVSTRRA
jgi:hypothetical protein